MIQLFFFGITIALTIIILLIQFIILMLNTERCGSHVRRVL
jgi:hypothetical protein